MKFLDYLRDKFLFLLCNLILYIITAVMMYFFDIKVRVIVLMAVIWFMPLISYIIIEGFKAKVYFDNVEKTMKSLDKKYLLPEVIKKPVYFEGELLHNVLKETSRNMHENVKCYRDKADDYREYIETWVHEIKTPLASAKLVIENNENVVTEKIDTQLDRLEFFVDQVLIVTASGWSLL